MITIKRGAATVATVNPLSSSNLTKAVMGDEQITLLWEAPAFVSYYLGDYITFEGANWTLNKLPTVKKLSSKTWQYNAVFQSTKYELIKAMYLLFDNTDTLPSGEFPLTGTANTFMELLVANLNRVAGSAVWTVGQVIENTDYKNLTFSNEDCLSVLARLASEFDTEYHVNNHIIHLRKISTEREITLQYGSTLYDIERSSVDSSDVVTRLYPFGSTKNLAPNYRGGNSPLRLPLTPPSGGGGAYIENNVNLYGIIEQSKTFDDIYPRLSSGGAGVVTGVGNYLEFTDSALDFNVNDYLLDGAKAKVHFNTGECAGYDFEIASYNHATKTFVLIPNTQENDFTLPTDDLKPAVGDKYVLLDIIMPPLYLAAAEAELLTRAQEYMSQNSTPKVAYKTTFSAIYAKLNLQNVECGDSVTVYDADMGVNEQIRIVKLTKGLTDFWTVQFDLSNTVTATRLQRIEGNLAAVENNVIVTNQRVNRNNLRAYQNTKELREMVFDPDGYFDAENIKPLSIETSMLSVGAKSQSFQLSSLLQPNYAGNPQVLQWSAGLLTHFTIVDDAIKEWTISQGSITITGGNQTSALYIYARCSRAGTTGDIYLSPVALKFNEGSTYYYFLIGVLHTPLTPPSGGGGAVRGISLTYGQTTINGQFIKTGVISSIDGATYFNLNTGEIGGNIKFRSTSGALKTVEQAIDEVEVGGRNFIVRSQITSYAPYSTTPSFSGDTLYTTKVGTVSQTVAIQRTGVVFSGLHTNSGFIKLNGNPMPESMFTRGCFSTNNSELLYFSYDSNTGRFVVVENYSSALTWILHRPFIGIIAGDIISIENWKFEKGNKPTDWSPAPEDVQSAIDTAQNAANTANQSVSSLNTYVDGAFKDGVIDSAEAKAIEKYINTVNTEYDNAISSYNVVANNSYLEGAPKTTLINAKVTLAGAKDSLMSAISTAIADGKTTVSEKAAVDAAYTSYKSAFGSYSTALENANKAIQQKLDSLSTDKVNAIEVGGRNLILDTKSSNTQVTFPNGVNYRFFFGLTPISNFGLKAGDSVVLAFNLDGVPAGYYCRASFAVEVNGSVIYTHGAVTYQSSQRAVCVYKLPVGTTQIAPYIALNTAAGSISFNYNSLKLEKGNKATDWSPAPEDIDASILVAKNAADAANAEIGNITSDGVFDKAEKISKRQEWEIIAGEVTPLVNQASSFGVSSSAYSNAFTTLANYLNAGATWVSPQIPFFVSDSQLTVNTTFASSSLSSAATFRSRYKSYYDAKIALMNAISAKAKQSGDDANTKITNLKPAGKNYLIGSRTDSLVGWIAYGGTMSVVTDAQYGKVVEYSRPAGGGDFMKVFSIDTSELKNTELVYYCIAKPISGTTIFNFGGWNETFTMLNNNSPYRNLGNGWRMYYKVFTAGSAIASGVTFGLNSVGGTWRFHSFGVAKGNTPPSDWDASPKEIDFLKQGYQASTDIQGGVVQTAILLLRNLAEQVTAGMSGLGNDNIGMWAGGTYQEALNSIAKIILRKDGSGQLAGGNIAWNTAGDLLVRGAIEALSGQFGLLKIVNASIIGEYLKITDSAVELKSGATSPNSYTIPAKHQLVHLSPFYGSSAGVTFETNEIGIETATTMPTVYVSDNYPAYSYPFIYTANSPVSCLMKYRLQVINNGVVVAESSNEWPIGTNTPVTSHSVGLSGVNVAAGLVKVRATISMRSTSNFSDWNWDGDKLVTNPIISMGAGSNIVVTAFSKRTVIGGNGFYSFANENRYLYFRGATDADDLFEVRLGNSILKMTETHFDIPAGLGGASINSSGTILAHWGKITGNGQNPGQVYKSGNNYTIYHYLGNTDYSLILTPISANVPYFSSKSANTVVVTCAGGFDFVLIRTK